MKESHKINIDGVDKLLHLVQYNNCRDINGNLNLILQAVRLLGYKL